MDDWELTVVRYGAATKNRPASLLLSDLAADFVELKHALARCRSSFALRRLTGVVAHVSGLMCLTLIKLDERSAFRCWARTARIAAREADDPVTYSWVLAQEAYGRFYSHDLTEAVTVAQQTRAVGADLKGVGGVLAAALVPRAEIITVEYTSVSGAEVRETVFRVRGEGDTTRDRLPQRCRVH